MKNRHILIVAKDARQGAKYAKNAGLPNFTYRVVRSASSITGIQSVDVHLVDGFDARPDSGAILARLRWARDIAYYSVSMPPEPVKDEGDGMGEQLEIDLTPVEVEEAFHAADMAKHEGRRHKSVDPVIEIVSEEPAADSPVHVDEAPADTAEQAPRKRRKRCKTCGRLTAADFSVSREGHDEAAHSSQSLFA